MASLALLAQVRSAPWFIVAVVMVAAFTDTLFYGIIVPFTPNILRERCGMDPGQDQMWNSVLIGIYGGAIFVTSPIFGYLADHTPSRQAPLLFGFAALACATVMMHLGNNVAFLLTARILQGASAACVYSAGFAMLHDAFGADKIGLALGWISPALTIGAFLGPTLGGLLYEVGGELAVFLCAYAIILVDVLMRLAVITKPRESERSILDDGPDGPSYGTLPTTDNGRQETLSEAPMNTLHLKFLSLRGLIVPTIGWMVIGAFLTAFDSVLPSFVQEKFHWSVGAAGLIFLPLFLPSTVLSPACGALCDKFAVARAVAAGGFFLCIPCFALLGLVSEDRTESYVVLCILLALIGSGTSFSGPPLMKQVAIVIEDAEKAYPGIFGSKGGSALAYGLYNSAFAMGNLIGPIIAGGVMTALGWSVMGWVFALISAATGILVLLLLGGWIGHNIPEGMSISSNGYGAIR